MAGTYTLIRLSSPSTPDAIVNVSPIARGAPFVRRGAAPVCADAPHATVPSSRAHAATPRMPGNLWLTVTFPPNRRSPSPAPPPPLRAGDAGALVDIEDCSHLSAV